MVLEGEKNKKWKKISIYVEQRQTNWTRYVSRTVQATMDTKRVVNG
jgi:hypothetical protein